MTRVDVLVVGAGFSGSVVAERLASQGFEVLVVDKRHHVGGNAYDKLDAQGVLIHPYGPHIFHTNGQRIADYLSNFTRWRPYEHRVLAKVGTQLVPIPINLDTLNSLYGLDLDPAGAAEFLEKVREPRDPLLTSEDVVLNSVGRDLYEKFFRGYTRKQWGLDPSQLAGSVAARIPTRTNRDDRYFTDTFQNMPLDGYTAMFNSMLDNPGISVEVGMDYRAIERRVHARHVVYTGPIDAYFNYCLGRLPYRSLRFQHKHLPARERFQPVGTVNYPNENEYTRSTEFKHLTGQAHTGTSVVWEFPEPEGDPYYPIPRAENEALFKRYAEMARKEESVTFVGRLAQYRYYNMDQCVGAALSAAATVAQKLGSARAVPVPVSRPAVMASTLSSSIAGESQPR